MKHFLLIFSFFAALILAQTVLADGYANYVYDSSDFATDIINYGPVGSYKDWLSGETFNNPENALGRPTVDTTGDDWYIAEDQPVPVNPVYPAFRASELTWLGEKGYIVLAFDHPVRDDENNPYGIDLIVFGNALQVIGDGAGWANGDPNLTSTGAYGFSEPGIVSVSQDGETWYSFTTDQTFMTDDDNFIKMPDSYDDGPFCDSFAPTLGRVYDPNDPNTSIGEWNRWWAEPTNPTLPLDPFLSFSDFGGYSIAQICRIYGNSAGGTGYDIGLIEELPEDVEIGLKWIQYVRIDDKSGGGLTDIDAISDVTACGDWKHPFPDGDLTHDCRVDMQDVAVLSQYWDNSYSTGDLMAIAQTWLECTWDCSE